MQYLIDRLQLQQKNNLIRTRLRIEKRQDNYCQINNKNYLSFISNDYLGLATHPELANAVQQGALLYGLGSSSSQHLGGYYQCHEQLEQQIANFTGFAKALIFSSGFIANLAVINSLIQSDNIIFEHRLNHASLLDATRLTKAKIYRYRDLQHLENLLKKYANKNSWIISDGVFSMDGTIAPLPDLLQLSKQYQTQLIIDDAHGFGVLGKTGRGILEHYQMQAEDNLIITASFGKALASQGAFVVGNAIMIESILQFARGFIYSTALSPALCHATLASLKLLQQETWRREYLKKNITLFNSGATAIQAIILSNIDQTLQAQQTLMKHGILVGAIRPPSVPTNSPRLRINLNANHRSEDIYFLREILCKILS